MQLCNACRRHIKASPCPFCGGAAATPVSSDRGGVSRAQILAGVALASVVAAGCTETPGAAPAGSSGTSASSGAAPEPTSRTPTLDSTQMPLYGAPPDVLLDAGRTQPAPDRSAAHASKPMHPPTRDTMPPAPAYGGPPPGAR